jgi:protein-disulfide isomerase
MSSIRKNIWGIGIVVLFVGALVAMWAAGRGAALPSSVGSAQEQVTFEIGAGDNVKGATDAKVTIVEFSDYQCPACRAYAPILDQIVKEFPNDVRLVYKHFPLKTIHLRAESAAKAAEAAALQGKFWEMGSLLFQNQDAWSRQNGNSVFVTYATELGLDTQKFSTDIESEAIREAVNEDYKYGLSLNVNSTPTIYLNGKKILNPNSYEEFKTLVQNEITASQ